MSAEHNSTFPWDQEFILKPVGYVQSELKEPSLKASREGLSCGEACRDRRRRAREIREVVAQIVVNPSLAGILDGLEDFSHALVLYWPHLADPASRELTRVHPMGRRDLAKVGVFASCSPGRPNPILVTAVKLVKVEKNMLTVKGLEAIDQSPVLDIKPYNRHYLAMDKVTLAPWMERIERELAD
jgi:tRNA (adenine37-N6)-methyltransferase